MLRQSNSVWKDYDKYIKQRHYCILIINKNSKKKNQELKSTQKLKNILLKDILSKIKFNKLKNIIEYMYVVIDIFQHMVNLFTWLYV
jgi:hypothetical protein